MTYANYMDAINEARRLVTTLLNDPEHGKLTFKGMRGLDDLTIAGPRELDNLVSGTVLAVGNSEWMGLTACEGERRHWQNFASPKVATSEELYTLALKEPNLLSYCHKAL